MLNRKFEILEKQLNSTDKKSQNEALETIISLKQPKEIVFLLRYLNTKKVKNGFGKCIKALGNSNRKIAVDALIDSYGNTNHHFRKLILKSLLKLGAFNHFISGNQIHVNIEEKIWSLVFGYSSKQLRNILKSDQETFQKEIDFAWRTTKHLRK